MRLDCGRSREAAVAHPGPVMLAAPQTWRQDVWRVVTDCVQADALKALGLEE